MTLLGNQHWTRRQALWLIAGAASGLSLHACTNTTLLMITHDVEEAIFLSQRLYVMSIRPNRLKAEICVELPQHRQLELKLSPEFIQIKRQVIHALKDSSSISAGD